MAQRGACPSTALAFQSGQRTEQPANQYLPPSLPQRGQSLHPSGFKAAGVASLPSWGRVGKGWPWSQCPSPALNGGRGSKAACCQGLSIYRGKAKGCLAPPLAWQLLLVAGSAEKTQPRHALQDQALLRTLCGCPHTGTKRS